MKLSLPNEELQQLQANAGLQLRWAGAADHGQLAALFASTRAEEMRQAAWPLETAQMFLYQQFMAQDAHYSAHYPGLRKAIILPANAQDSSPWVGRVYWDWLPDELRLVDISLWPQHCGQGLGGRLITALQALAGARGQGMSLHVMNNNPAQRLYRRLGFESVDSREPLFARMHWPAPAQKP